MPTVAHPEIPALDDLTCRSVAVGMPWNCAKCFPLLSSAESCSPRPERIGENCLTHLKLAFQTLFACSSALRNRSLVGGSVVAVLRLQLMLAVCK